ncbi:MAG: ATP-binding cassette domain-containing protein [Coriobacteriales bacterium]|nr:ATP-binding cassette domain-containing protein [Coriobacteriales bacterium]
MEALVAKDLTFSYPTRVDAALDNVSLTVRKGEFVVLCGSSGCGKTTLMRHFKPALTPHGRREGTLLFEGKDISSLSLREVSAGIGFVMQNPDNQIVTDKVWHELAFGLESLGEDSATIRLRVAEMTSFFGIQTWFHKDVTDLSGGQKQLLALASIMAMQPSVLLLDEPTSQLDPIAAAEFLQTVGKINRDLGITVVLTEHRLEEAFALATRAVVLDKGKIVLDGAPTEVAQGLRSLGSGMFRAMPAPMRIWAGINNDKACPMNVRDGRVWVDHIVAANKEGAGLERMADYRAQKDSMAPAGASAVPAVELDDVWFRYEKNLPDVVRGASLKAYPGKITAILGGNGTGKTTTLSLIAGLNKPYRGTVRIEGKPIEKIPVGQIFKGLLGVLPQNPQALFTAKTVEEDLLEILSGVRISREARLAKVHRMAALCKLDGLLGAHPYDLSGGEQQRAALAKVLLLRPKILLLDEPTKGCDAEFKAVLAGILRKLTDAGATIIMVSHDIEFCAEHADTCALFFDGEVVKTDEPYGFFSGNSFYTSAANRMARHQFPQAITVSDVIVALGGEPDHYVRLLPDDWDDTSVYEMGAEDPEEKTLGTKKRKMGPARVAMVALTLTSLIASIVMAILERDGMMTFISAGEGATLIGQNPAELWKYTGILLWIIASLATLALSFSWKRTAVSAAKNPDEKSTKSHGKDKLFLQSEPLTARTWIAVGIALLLIPATLLFGVMVLGGRYYYLTALMIVLECMVPFLLVFEGRKPQAREIVILAVLSAIAIAGRVAFFMLPQFKPVTAFVIVAAVAFGGEAGFLVGAVSGFASNMFFGQGPWTIWQMFSYGLIGLLAGILFRKGVISRASITLAIFGGLCAFLIYGPVMDVASTFMWGSGDIVDKIVPHLISGIPFNLVHGAATVFFLIVVAKPMLEKLDRIKVKYGLVEKRPEVAPVAVGAAALLPKTTSTV